MNFTTPLLLLPQFTVSWCAFFTCISQYLHVHLRVLIEWRRKSKNIL